MLSIKKILGLEYYTSELDKFLNNFDATHPKLSLSQQVEKNKYDRLNKLRDQPNDSLSNQSVLWNKF